MSGDWRLAYLIWLTGVENGNVRDEALEPLPGLAPLNGGLQAFAEFFRIDADLVQAAAEGQGAMKHMNIPLDALRAFVKTIPALEQTALLQRVAEGDPHVAADLRSRFRKAASRQDSPTSRVLRTASDLRERASAIRTARENAAAERRRAECLRQKQRTERARLAALRQRGEDVWREVEAEVERRNASGYDRAASLIFDLRALADEDGATAEFANRLKALRKHHERKQRFIQRLHSLT